MRGSESIRTPVRAKSSSRADFRVAAGPARGHHDVLRALTFVYLVLGPTLVLAPGVPFLVGVSDLLAPVSFAVMAVYATQLLRSPFVFYVSYLVLVFFSSTFASGSGVLETIRYGSIFAPFFVAYKYASRGADVDRLLRWGYYAGAIAIGFGLVVQSRGVSLFGEQGQQLYFQGQAQNRAAGLVSNTAPFGQLVSTWVVLGIVGAGFLFRRPTAILAITLAVGSLSFLLSSSRGGMVAALVGLLVALVFALGRVSGRAVLRLLMLSALAAVLVLLISVSDQRLPVDDGFVGASWERINILSPLFGGESDFGQSQSRLDAWSTASEHVLDHSLIGTGATGYFDRTAGAVDNSYLSAAAHAGVLGAALYVLFWLTLLRRGVASSSPYRVMFVALVVTQIVVGVFMDMQSQWYSMSFSFALIGLLYGATCASSDLGLTQTGRRITS